SLGLVDPGAGLLERGAHPLRLRGALGRDLLLLGEARRRAGALLFQLRRLALGRVGALPPSGALLRDPRQAPSRVPRAPLPDRDAALPPDAPLADGLGRAGGLGAGLPRLNLPEAQRLVLRLRLVQGRDHPLALPLVPLQLPLDPDEPPLQL